MARGRVKLKVVPCWGVLVAQMRPWWCSMISWAIARPRPVPPFSRASEASTWLNRSKIVRSWFVGIPRPVSCTEKVACCPSRVAVMDTVAPGGENLIALPSRLVRVWMIFSVGLGDLGVVLAFVALAGALPLYASSPWQRWIPLGPEKVKLL